jgi:VWFA-related protein
MKINLFWISLYIGLVFSVSTFSQTKETTIRVSVTDNKFRIIKDLKKEDFIVKENGVSQEIIGFQATDNEPLSVLFLMDMSGSISQNARQINAKAALEFIQKSNIKNDYAIAEFNDTLKESADWGSTDNQLVSTLTTIANNTNSQRNTSIYSAISWSLRKFESAKYAQKVLFLFSDGENNDVKNQITNEAKDTLRKSNIIFYGISIRDFELSDLSIDGQSNLSELSTLTGGESYFPQTKTEFAEAIEKIAAENKSFYLLSYIPKKISEKKDWQDISVTLSPGKKKVLKFTVRTRPKLYRKN